MMMLKTREVYLVSVTLQDGQAMLCTLLSKPDAALLAAVAAAQNAPADFGKALTLAADIAVPAVGKSADESNIAIGNIVIGTVRVETQQAYGLPVKRPRQPKTDAPATATAPAAKKRGRRPRAAACCPTAPVESAPVESAAIA